MDGARLRAAMLVVVPMLIGGCEHAVVGNAVALGMTCCLFFGTLQLGRKPTKPGDAKRSTKPAG